MSWDPPWNKLHDHLGPKWLITEDASMPDPTPKPMAEETDAKYGICCACGYSGDEETPCPNRKDETHCVHWWDVELADA